MTWIRRLLRWLSLALVVGLGLSLLPPVQARGKALVVLAEAMGLDVPRPFAAPVARIRGVRVGGVAGDLYVPGGPAPPLLVLPGAAERGPDDARVVRLARSLARAKRTVFVPRLALARLRADRRDIEDIVAAARGLARHPLARGRPVLLGFSFGGSYALVAAADERLRGLLALVATFGAYADLEGLIQAATTGVSTVGGRRVAWRPDPSAPDIVAGVVVDLLSEADGAAVRMVLDGGRSRETLPPELRAAVDLVRNRDPALTSLYASRLPARTRALIRALSPLTVAGRIDAPVIAMHARDDPAVPPAEAERLRSALPGARVVLVGGFRHVDALGDLSLADLWRSWSFVTTVLGPGE